MLKVVQRGPREAVSCYPLAESLSKVTVSPKTNKMFKMLANYKLQAKLIVKGEKKKA